MKTYQKLELNEIFNRTIRPLLVLLILGLIGVIGYELIEGLNPLDAVYMTIISLTTVGYETPHSLSTLGKLFTCIYLLFSVVIFLYLGGEFVKHLINLNLSEILTKRKMDSRINSLKNHYVICGFGRTGKSIAKHLLGEGLDFVVIDQNFDIVKEAVAQNFLAFCGDSTDDAILKEAKIEDAKGLFASLSSDAENLFVTIAARELNPSIDIVVRCSSEVNRARFLRAGAVHTVSPYAICGRRMVSSVIRPLVADFLDEALDTQLGLQLRMEQINVPPDSPLCGKKLSESEIRSRSGAFILAIKRSGEYIHNPTANTEINPFDFLIVLGSADQLITLEKLLGIEKGEHIS